MATMQILNSPLTAENLNTKYNFSGVRIFNGRLYYDADDRDGKGTIIISRDFRGENKQVHLPDDVFIKTKINVYGGVCFCPTDFGVVYSDSKTGDLNICDNGGVKTLLSGFNFGDISYDNNKILFVAEEKTGHKPKQHIGQIDLTTGDYVIIAEGADFYHAPSMENDKIIWLEWNLPHMPWDNSAVVVLENGKSEIVSEGIGHFQPSLKNGDIYYAKDTGEYFNIFKNGKNICPLNIDFYMPLWVYGMKTYVVLDDQIMAVGAKNGEWFLGELSDYGFNPITTTAVGFNSLHGNGNDFTSIRRYKNKAPQIVLNAKQVITTRTKEYLGAEYFSDPEQITFNHNGKEIFAYYYPPKNPDYDENQKPPLIVKSHGGPTGQATNEYNPKIQFWTSRGFAVLDVNYSGSTGFGSAYRNRLNGNWGELDVRELEKGAKYCVNNGLANPDQLIISGSSAGGYSVLCGLAFGDTFTAGTCIYGIGDLTLLAEETHKLEANYCDTLIAPYNRENKGLYKSRSPINSADKISAPVLFLQGLDDVVVPPNQSKVMYDCLLKNKVDTALINYVGEGHGFRNPETRTNALESELQFYDYVFNGNEPDYKINEITELDYTE